MATVAVITGTGIALPADFHVEPIEVHTRYGTAHPMRAAKGGEDLIFLPRHGRDHVLLPHQINHRANIAALAKLGVERIFATNAVGALRKDLPPGSLVLLSDFIDFTRSKTVTMHAPSTAEDLPHAHTDFSQPYCPELRSVLLAQAAERALPIHGEGTYICVDGPRFETPAEVRLFASWGADVVGMTGLPEAILARECGICYAAVAIVANLGTGLSTTPLHHNAVVQTVGAAARALMELFLHAIPRIPVTRSCPCTRAKLPIT
jgi:5'-methylthioadenosine phosphorylase